jgi:RNA polymerase sigma-70 factor (ECF subfamily)
MQHSPESQLTIAMSVTWEQFVETHAEAILSAALRVLARQADADDVAQDVFMEIFRTGNHCDLHGKPALIRTMATRRALDRLRRRKPQTSLIGTEASSRDFEPGEYAIADELETRLRASLAGLPPREAETFCLFYYEGCSLPEIAAALHVSLGAVTKALCKARGKLSKALGTTTTKVTR